MASPTHSTTTSSTPSSSDGRSRLAADTYRSGISALSPTNTGSSYTRLVILAPEDGIDHGKLFRELSSLLTPSVSEMVFVGLGPKKPTSPVSRRLAELAFMTQELPVRPNKQIVDVGSWAEAVQRVAQPGDLIVCVAGRQGNQLMEDLSQVTIPPVRLLSGLQLPLQTRLARALKRLMFDLFPLAVLAGFFWLQVQIDAQTNGFLQTLVIIMTVLVELGLIFVWSLFIR